MTMLIIILLNCIHVQTVLTVVLTYNHKDLSISSTITAGPSSNIVAPLFHPPPSTGIANTASASGGGTGLGLGGIVSVANKTVFRHHTTKLNDTKSSSSSSTSNALFHERFDRSVEIEESGQKAFSSGDVIIGGLFAVHLPDENNLLCGNILDASGMWTESMIYAIKVINDDPNVLSNTTLGFEIRDDCSDTSRALQQTLNFLDVNHDQSNTCSDEVETIGVVGTGRSSTSKAVSDLLSLFKIPQISYSATASEFSKKSRFPYFFRTVPSDKYQARVMCDIAKKYQWNLVNVIYSDDIYGIEGKEELEANFAIEDICVVESLIIGDETADDEIKDIVERLKNSKAEIIFTFCGKNAIQKILEESKVQNMTEKTWIACDSWAINEQVIEEREHIVQGMLGVIPKAAVDEGFKEYLLNLDPLSHSINPFYQITLESYHKCTFNQSAASKGQCHGNETFSGMLDEGSSTSIWTAFIMDTVFAFAHALDDMYKENGELGSYHDYIKKVHFKGVTNPTFTFNENGDPLARYEIFNLQWEDKDDIYTFQNVGEWDPFEGFWNKSLIQWKDGSDQPFGRCSQSCPSGMHQEVDLNIKCCWTCEECEDDKYTTGMDQQVCSMCETGSHVNVNRTNCITNDVIYLAWSSTISVLIILMSVAGIVAALICLVIFIKYSKTPTIKATSTELSYVLIIGVLFCFSCTYMFIGEPTYFKCNARLMMMGVSFSIYVGALLMKTHRISSIFNRKLSDGRPSIFLNIKYQLLFIVVIVTVLVVILVMIIHLSPSYYEENNQDMVTYLQCSLDNQFGFLAAVVYNLILAIMCGYQAFRIRKLPGQFNDSRSISFTILTCCLIWFIFLVMFFTTNSYVKAIISCIGFIANGFSALICMFFPKVWIIYMRPEKNVRQSTLNMKCAGRITTIATVSGSVGSSINIIKRNGTTSMSNNSPALSHHHTPSLKEMEDSSTSVQSDRSLGDFLEKLHAFEDNIRQVENERDIAVEQANQLYQELEDMHIIHENNMKELSEACHTERQNLLMMVQGAGLTEDDLELMLKEAATDSNNVSWQLAETDNSVDSVSPDTAGSVNEIDVMLENTLVEQVTNIQEPMSRLKAERHKLRQTVQDLSKERERLKHTIIQQCSGIGQEDNNEEDEEGGNIEEDDKDERQSETTDQSEQLKHTIVVTHFEYETNI